MTKRFTVLKKLENCYIEADVIDTYIERLVKDGKSVGWVTVGILDNGNPMTYKDCVDLLNENEQLKSDVYDWKASAEDYLKLGKSLKRENEQLKETVSDWSGSYDELFEDVNRLEEENGQLQEENKGLNEQLSVMKSNGLKVLEFYEYKLKNADKKEFDNAREELWIVKEVLSEMGVIKND